MLGEVTENLTVFSCFYGILYNPVPFLTFISLRSLLISPTVGTLSDEYMSTV